MRRKILAGVGAGAILGLGAVLGASFAEQDARGQTGQRAQQSIPPEIASANLRSQRGIKQATTVWNQLGIYLAEPGTQIRAKGPRVNQLPAVGGGIPLSALDSETQSAIRDGGPQGPKGDPGPAGPAGSTGPTDGASGRTIPPPALDSGQLLPSNLPPTPNRTDVTTSVAGRLFLTASYQYVVACPSSATVDSWIVLNGTPIPSTFARFGDVAAVPLPPGGGPLRTNSGVTDEVIDAGTHRVQVGVRCSTGTSAPAALGPDVIASAIVLG